jgi:hypothetical protein
MPGMLLSAAEETGVYDWARRGVFCPGEGFPPMYTSRSTAWPEGLDRGKNNNNNNRYESEAGENETT